MSITRAINLAVIVAVAWAIPATTQTAVAADPAAAPFIYQGKLKLDGLPVTDTCDFEFTLWADEIGVDPADQVGPTLTFDGGAGNPPPIDVSFGLFTAQVNFGANALDGDPRWLEIAVSCPAGAGAYEILAPRNPITMAPYAAQTRGIHVDDTGRVGIGTKLPAETFHVAGHMALTADGFDPHIQLTSDDTADATTMHIKSLDAVGFAVTDSTDDPLMVVTDNGDVGIGTTRPDARLHVEVASGNLMQVGDREGLFVTDRSDVGIGTDRPDAKLEVSDNSTDTNLTVIGNGNPLMLVKGTGNTLTSVTGDATNAVLSVTGRGTTLLEVKGSGRLLGNHIAYFDSTGTPLADGIAIRLANDHTNRENNFVTFLNGQSRVTGRIEGFDLESGDWIAPPPLPDIGFSIDPGIVYNPDWFEPGSLPSVNWSPGSLPSLAFERGSLPTLQWSPGALPNLSVTGGSLPSANFNPGTLPSVTWNDGSLPSFSGTYTTVVGVRVMTGFSWSDGSSPSLSFNDGSLPSLTFSPGSFPNITFSRGTLPNLSFSRGQLPAINWGRGALPSLTFNGGSLPEVLAPPVTLSPASFDFDLPTPAEIEALLCWSFETGNSDLIQLDPVGHAVAQLKQDVMKRCKDEGVTYGSKGADYAEWLPKMNPSDRFQFGQIVGVHGGKVSLKTEGAEQIMAVSRAPVVIGNVPAKSDEHLYTTVGFMGQLPVVVHGRVRAGDYIIPSGQEDGTAIAISPEDLRLEHLGRTMGRAWSDSTNDVYGLINVAIGLNGNEPKIILERQQQRIEAQDKRQIALAAENARLAAQLDATNAHLATMMASIERLEEQVLAPAAPEHSEPRTERHCASARH